MRKVISVWLLMIALSWADPVRAAVDVTVAGNNAHAEISFGSATVAELNLAFDDASNLTPSSIGITAQLVSLTDPLLRLRLPNLGLQTQLSALPLLITVEPPNSGGLSFRNTVRVEIHTHLLPYTAGTSLRLFKAPLGGAFRDITDEVAPGSVRTRGTTGGFSQFLILVDLRQTRSVINEKFSWTRNRMSGLSAATRAPLDALLDDAQLAVDQSRFADAIAALDSFRAQVSAGAGSSIPNQWTTTQRNANVAGDLLGGASTLKFSVGYLRDYGN
jgi:hypothetical protein